MTAGWAWLIYGLGVALGAAWLTPPVFNVGRALVAAQWLPGLAPFPLPVYFRRIALVLAMVGLPWLWRRLPAPLGGGLGLLPVSRLWRPLVAGWALALASVLSLGALLVAVGVLEGRPLAQVDWARLVLRALSTGAAVAFVEETLFRGALLASLSQSQGRRWALVSTSLAFTALHFVAVPARGPVQEGAPWHAGFALLAAAAEPWREGGAVLGTACTLALMGLVLGAVTLRRRGLGLALGLHAGWVMGIIGVAATTRVAPGQALWVDGDLRQGLAPLGLMVLTGCGFVLGLPAAVAAPGPMSRRGR